MCACALASAQSSVALRRLKSSEPSTMTRADFSSCFKAMPRACVSRVRSESTLFSTSSSCSTSCDWRTRPDAKRVSCWLIIPAWRACSTSSRSARRPARSILPVAVRTWMRSSAAVSGSAISTPTCDTRSCQRWSSCGPEGSLTARSATGRGPVDMAIRSRKGRRDASAPARRGRRRRRPPASRPGRASSASPCAASQPQSVDGGSPARQRRRAGWPDEVTKSTNVTTCSLIRPPPISTVRSRRVRAGRRSPRRPGRARPARPRCRSPSSGGARR